ncbi:hypothetical protein BCR33DRAFT_716843 [Rhizoclosmatium globosum]|uniref:Secreted protein n=1 Tax=Rhizoclosmatium globosum TaxID=329046 RepID=A0A1Y2CD05_9FUNG|nr:hypothetical protein BCR33DRAFT_716843 [Rhizoclosmatium globosum]|eukprot:ORY44929.1 hypothetical protein BCR33DRAFT_716843 [Rhizoclosmatium globosum]
MVKTVEANVGLAVLAVVGLFECDAAASVFDVVDIVDQSIVFVDSHVACHIDVGFQVEDIARIH